jgi:hypothetical protein
MSTFFAFFGTLLLSLFVALLAGLQLADHFRASDEFVPVMIALSVFALVSMAIFVATYAKAREPTTFNAVAIVLVAAAAVLVALPDAVEWFASGPPIAFRISRQSAQTALELLVPIAFLVLIQWALIRRRWSQERGHDELTLWPWVTTILAGLAILNPLGLELIAGALRYAPTDWLRDLWRMVALSGLAVLILMAWLECHVRSRILRRRSALPRVGGELSRPVN